MCFPLQKVDITSRAMLDIMTKTTEYLQPNPGQSNRHRHVRDKQKPSVFTSSLVCVFISEASRAKLSMINTMSKIRGQEKGPGYPQAESVLGDAMLRFGRELGEESCFGKEETFLQRPVTNRRPQRYRRRLNRLRTQ